MPLSVGTTPGVKEPDRPITPSEFCGSDHARRGHDRCRCVPLPMSSAATATGAVMIAAAKLSSRTVSINRGDVVHFRVDDSTSRT
jgi:hypothetical protein